MIDSIRSAEYCHDHLRKQQGPPNNTMNPTADGRLLLAAHVGHSPAAGYGERWAPKGHA